jgi:hypothetical protein
MSGSIQTYKTDHYLPKLDLFCGMIFRPVKEIEMKEEIESNALIINYILYFQE